MSLAIEKLFQELWKELGTFDPDYDAWLNRVSRKLKNLQVLVYTKINIVMKVNEK